MCWFSGDIISAEPMSAIPKRRWLTLAVVFALAAVASFHSFDSDFGTPQHLSFVVLPYIGSLVLLPSDPGSWITPEARPAAALEVFTPALPPRAPPV